MAMVRMTLVLVQLLLRTSRRRVQAAGLIKMQMVRLYLRQVNIRLTMLLAQAMLMSLTGAGILLAVMFMTALRPYGVRTGHI